jgi:NADH:ubiquinone oxidoreductase subunit 6 (subunit J)
MKTENKQIKASKWALGILFVLSAVVLVLFFGVGYGNTTYLNGKNLTDPQYTGLLLIWLYALVGICVLSVLGFGIVNAFRNMKTRTKGQQRTGFAGWVFLFTFALLVVSYFLSSTTPVRKGDGELVKTAWELQISDVCLYSIYGLVVVSVLCSILSMLGVFKARR